MKTTINPFVSHVRLVGMVLCSTLLFFGCSKSGDGPENESEAKKEVDIYVAGYTGQLNGPYTVKYWKNGKVNKLTEGTAYDKASSIFVDKGDVYVAGTLRTIEKGERAVYWKNGQRMDLAVDQGVYTRASAIGVAKGKVYVAGTENADAVYWVDDAIHRFPSSDDHTISQYFAIHVTDKEDVYIAGMLTNRTTQVVKYWKNNVEHIVTSPAAHVFGKVAGLFIDESDVYIAGHYQNANGIGWAKYWKNSDEYTLTENVSGGRAHDIYVENGNVHVIGSGKGAIPLYWKNGKEQPIEIEADHYGSFDAITVHNGDVYIAGTTGKSSGDFGVGGYWKNGKWNALEEAQSDNYTTVTAIVVVER